LAEDSEIEQLAALPSKRAAQRDAINELARGAFLAFKQARSYSVFEELLVAIYAYASSTLYSVYGIKDPEHRKDIFQNTVVNFLIYADTYDERRGPFLPWWHGILRNAAYDFTGKMARTRIREDSMTSDEEAADRNLFAQRSEKTLIVHEALNKLRADERELLWLYYVEGFTAEEISRSMEESLHNTKYYLRRALGNLRKLMQPDPSAPERHPEDEEDTHA
jgi:RNA polymerase sigma-70 factor (ECF subfamily)